MYNRQNKAHLQEYKGKIIEMCSHIYIPLYYLPDDDDLVDAEKCWTNGNEIIIKVKVK